jgi:hypothetical protein
MRIYCEIKKFIIVMQKQYAEALATGDTEGMGEASYALTKIYAASGNLPLAARWGHECEKHIKDPTKRASLNMALICSILKKKLTSRN